MLRPMPIEPVPPDTARVARAAFPTEQRYLCLADEVDRLLTAELFTTLFPASGQPALAPWRLGLVTILQFAEGFSDRQAADMVRSRIDWKYVRRLELADAGVAASVLREFRSRLIAGAAAALLFETLRTWCRNRRLVKARGRQRTDSTHILATVRALNRLEGVGDPLRHTLKTLAVVAPEWLRAVSPPEWRARYTRRAEEDRLPTIQTARAALTRTLGNDGGRLRAAVAPPDAPRWLREVPRRLPCAGSGAKTLGGMAPSSSGARPTTSPRRHGSAAPPMIPQPPTPASTPRRGSGPKCISRNPVRRPCRT
jgi:transposase